MLRRDEQPTVEDRRSSTRRVRLTLRSELGTCVGEVEVTETVGATEKPHGPNIFLPAIALTLDDWRVLRDCVDECIDRWRQEFGLPRTND